MGRAGYTKGGSELCTVCHRAVKIMQTRRYGQERVHRLRPRQVRGVDEQGRERTIYPFHVCAGRPVRSHEEAREQLAVMCAEGELEMELRQALERYIVQTCEASTWEEANLDDLAQRLGALHQHMEQFGAKGLRKMARLVSGRKEEG